MIAIHRFFKTPLIFRSYGLLDESLKVFVNLIWVEKTAQSLCGNDEGCWGKGLVEYPLPDPKGYFGVILALRIDWPLGRIAHNLHVWFKELTSPVLHLARQLVKFCRWLTVVSKSWCI